MGDVEEMIGELEDEDPPEEEAPEEEEEEEGEAEGDEDAFGLDLDSAWSSPDRDG